MVRKQSPVKAEAEREAEETDTLTSSATSELTEDERWVIEEMRKRGVELKIRDDRVAVARPASLSTKRRFFRVRTVFDRNHISALKKQMEWNPLDHSHYVGYLAPNLGLAEIGIDMPYQPRGWNSLLSMAKVSTPACRHIREDSWIPVVEDGPLSQTNRSLDGKDIDTPQRLHLTRRDGDICIELSNYSPLIAPSLVYAHVYPECTIKIYFRDTLPRERMEERCEEILQSFLYELNTRNGLLFSIIRHPLSGDLRGDERQPTISNAVEARFPLTSIQPEVARMFNFASQASGNPTLAFLSYFQVLEYFLFNIVRRGVVRNLRNAMLDHRFDEKNDASLIRLIEVVERSSGSMESQRLRLLIKECVREGEVTSFLQQGTWGNHFSNKGPIEGAPTLNLKDKSNGILDQVSERVYKIRNRIVHAKDDPKYGDAKVLLPESREADSLAPDVQLVRLLAMEVILESQGRQ